MGGRGSASVQSSGIEVAFGKWEYLKPMKPQQNSEFDRFTTALRKILSVPHEEMQRRLEEDKRLRTAKGRKAGRHPRQVPQATEIGG
jgi:hypothetical protein